MEPLGQIAAAMGRSHNWVINGVAGSDPDGNNLNVSTRSGNITILE